MPSAKAVSPHLDVRNVMWLLAAMVIVVAPHMLRLPSWVGILFVVVVGWRAWIAWAALRFPPRLLMWALTIAATLGTFQQYGRIFGRESGVTLLIVMTALKLLEMRSQRDVTLCIYLGFFLVITNFLFSQSIPLGIYMLACVWIFVGTLVGFNRVGRAPTLSERMRPAGALLVQALPLMVAFFILFPRAQGPLWALPHDSRSGQTGLSESMTPGNIANLIKSDTIAFRVQFAEKLPPYRNLYWRGPVLVDFDGATWRMPELPGGGNFSYAKKESLTKYTVTLEPHNKTWLFALDVPAELPPNSYLLSDLQLRSRRPIVERYRYEMGSWLTYQYGLRASAYSQDPALRFDETRNPRTVALGRQWARENPDPRVILSKAAQLFGTGYSYTLEPPPLDPVNPYDDFLFNSKNGFCEHYAGSFTLLMRAAGIPARVVTGYQGGEVNPLNAELIVLQADAHAWSEIWVKEEGWVRIDPTAAVSPLRTENGVNAALGPIGVIPTLIAADVFGILSNVRFAWQMMNSQWEQWVVGYNLERQRQFFSQLGMPGVDWRTLGIWLMVSTFLVGGLLSIALIFRERPRRREASAAAWDRFCRKLAAAGLARAPHEGPLDFLRRVKAARPQLAADVEAITERYVEARYGNGASKEELRTLARMVRDFHAA
ncbi:MAG: transglutaminase TgpA family protein [Usitatibacter sp.]